MDYDNFFLPSGDLKKGKEFYQNLLGLPIKFDFSDMGMVAFKVGDSEPAIILKDTAKFPAAKPTIWFVVDNVRDEYVRLGAKGLKFLSEPYAIHTGMAVEFEDPYGNRLGITDYSKGKSAEFETGDKTVAITKHGVTHNVQILPIKETNGFISGLDTKNLRDKFDRNDGSKKKSKAKLG